MKKLTFERAILVIFILIILISTSDITSKYIEIIIKKDSAPLTTSVAVGNLRFPNLLMTADKLYNAGNYEKAAEEYIALTLNSTLNPEQKAYAYFRMAICQYNLGKYQQASDSFIKVTTLNPNDSLAYNNAAVSTYKANNIKKAIELQQKSLNILPTVEYYYNLARMYEDNEQYNLAADNYLTVAKGEQNITKLERIDPVRVKEKAARLLLLYQPSIIQNANNVLLTYKLTDSREVLTIDEKEMQLKQDTFTAKVENKLDKKSIVAQYDREKYDPYNLITELLWSVYKDGRLIYKKTSDKIDLIAADSGSYEIKLNIKYNGKEKLATKTVNIKENLSTINDGKSGEIVLKPPTNDSTKYYMYAVYEQLFESNFKISSSGYTDNNGVVWGKDNGIEALNNKKLAVDRASSLIVNNATDKDAGLWINLDSLIKNQDIRGKTIRISFYAREITDNAEIYVNARVKTNNMIATTKDVFTVPFQFEQKSIKIYVPQDATGITVSIKTMANEQFNIDGFTVTD